MVDQGVIGLHQIGIPLHKAPVQVLKDLRRALACFLVQLGLVHQLAGVRLGEPVHRTQCVERPHQQSRYGLQTASRATPQRP